jgi:serine protease Do
MGVSEVGKTIRVTYIRGGRAATANVKLTAASAAAAAGKTPEKDVAKELSNIIGVKFRAITADDRRRYRIPASVQGVMVQAVESGSDAYGKLQPNMVVTEVNFQPVASADQAIAAAEAAKKAGKPVLLQIIGRDGEAAFLSVRPR